MNALIARVNKRDGLSALLLLTFFGSAIAQNSEFDAGEKLYRQCAACHQIGVTAGNAFGPQLNGVMERGAAALSDFDYSDAFVNSMAKDVKWNASSLSAFLESPLTNIPGTKMIFPGMKNEEDRLAVIVYLSSFDTQGNVNRPENNNNTDDVKTAGKAPRPLATEVKIPEHGVFHLGRPALDAEVAAWDIDVRPDGKGLPEGKGTALLGVDIYDSQCAACHGDFGEGTGRWPVLAGGIDSLTEERPEKTVGSYWPYLSTVYDYIRRAMPFGNARSLSDDDVYSVTAYLMYLNDLVDEDFELSSDNFSDIRLPNEHNFKLDDRALESHYKRSVGPCMSDCIKGDAVITQRARVLDVTPD